MILSTMEGANIFIELIYVKYQRMQAYSKNINININSNNNTQWLL